MSRFRVMILTTGLFLVSATVTLNGWAQGPGGGRGGRGGGPPGGFGGPMGMRGGGFGGDSLLSLALRPVVHEELKVTDKQKTQLGSLNDDYDQRRRQLFDGMRQNGNDGGNGRRGGDRGNFGGNNANNQAGVAPGNTGAGEINAFTSGYELNPYALNVPQVQTPLPQTEQQDDRQARFQMMREGMSQLDRQADVTLSRILTNKQFQRLNQIQIQSQGLSALVRPDVAEKVQLDETQVVAIQAVLNDRRTAQREVFSKQASMFRSLRNQSGRGANNDNPADSGANRDQAKAGNPGNGGDNQRREGQGGPGGRGGFDREAFQKFMEQPEVKAQMDRVQAENTKVENQAKLAVNKILTKYQIAAYKKLQGAPFDVSKLRPNFGGPGGNRGPNAGQANNAAGTDGAAAAGSAAAKAAEGSSADAKKSTTSKAKAKTKRSTVR